VKRVGLPKKSTSVAGSAEWQVLLECARPYSDASRLSEQVRQPLDWPFLLALADDHGMLALLASRIRDFYEISAPPEIREQLRDWQRAQTVFTLSLTAELFRLLQRFAAAGIEALTIKGPALSVRCYGDPGLRQYSDLDLIVRGADIHRLTEAMIALGCEPRVPLKAIQAGKFPGEYVFTRTDTKLLVEFHTERTFRYHPRPLRVEKLFERQIRVPFDGHDVSALSTEDELLLICIHGAKHFWERLMWIADVAALVTWQSVDWDRAAAAAQEVGAERMLRVGLRLAADVLAVRLPDPTGTEVHADAAAGRIAAQIAQRLPLADSAPLTLFERAAFRMKMRGGFLRGTKYLLRLSLSPTEEDWVSGSEEKRPWLVDAAGRPFRLARKHGRWGSM
jgi:hypothetical protein